MPMESGLAIRARVTTHAEVGKDRYRAAQRSPPCVGRLMKAGCPRGKR